MLITCFLLSFGAPAATLPSPAAKPYLVVPGQRLGNTRLGADVATSLAPLGPPDFSDAAMQKGWATWFGKGHPPAQLDIYTTATPGTASERKTVQAIRATSTAFYLANGLRVGATLQQIQVRYGRLPLATTYRLPAGKRWLYDAVQQGVAFELDGSAPASHCRALFVHQPGQAAAKLYLAPGAYLPEVPVRR